MNPLLSPVVNPIFLPVLHRMLLIFILGFILVVLLNKFNLATLFQSNVGKRYIGWMLVAPLYIGAVFFGGYMAEFIILLFLVLGINEATKIANLPKLYINILYILAIYSVYIVGYHPERFYSLPVVYFMLFTLAGIRENSAKNSQHNTSTSLYISIWLIFSLCHFVLLNNLNGSLDNTKSLLVLIGFAVPFSDIFAYLVGNFFHKINFLENTKIASELSKNKTYVGAIGNIIGAWLGIAVMYFVLKTYLPLYHWVIIGILIGVMGVAGDITESMLKRAYKVKDSGDIIPGHGGVLDRIDSVLRVVVILYYYFLMFLY